MVFKLISSQSILAKVMADLNLSEEDMKVSDFRSWIGEAVEKIGAVSELLHKVSGVDDVPYLSLVGHQAPLPCDLHQLDQVAFSFTERGPWFPMRKATGSFAAWDQTSKPCSKCSGKVCQCIPNLVPEETMIQLVRDMLDGISREEALEMLNTNQNLRTTITNLINAGSINSESFVPFGRLNKFNKTSLPNSSLGLQYSIKPGYIMTNVHSGFLKLSYNAVPLDEDGYPLVPDLASFSEAVYWYIAMKSMYPTYLRGGLDHERYYSIRRSWNFYRQQAYAELMMPNTDGLESIKNNWNKLVPEFNDHSTYYSHTGERQMYYNQQYR